MVSKFIKNLNNFLLQEDSIFYFFFKINLIIYHKFHNQELDLGFSRLLTKDFKLVIN